MRGNGNRFSSTISPKKRLRATDASGLAVTVEAVGVGGAWVVAVFISCLLLNRNPEGISTHGARG
jgi:hypothetical protein